ncbi:hypothetical protein CROQUDRAFT_111312 [Cronartium quercuum f. sp. fusiforme G11]|uniref:Uncharacterized protein n=1 Tax=Cronartium quercuum f. sp. fusiforme G11 TaxID=708437 RepID=A0A9P6N6Z1_9BASI|nr:hypothetical protein CROQUDRAFT_111312 [Cronartium quercuum f. sp. fusiforme G11]
MHQPILINLIAWSSCILFSSILRAQVIQPTVSSYATSFSKCPPSTSLLRLAGSPIHSNQSLCQEEAAYQRGRRSLIAPLWKSCFTSGIGAQTGYASLFQHDDFRIPNMALAHSGGGLRASLYGAGVLQAL